MSAVLLCAMLLSGAAQDPVRVTASLSAERINVGETTTLQITVETRGTAPEEIRVPDLTRDLEILGTSDYTQTQITVPGGRTRVTRRDVVIIARSQGVYRIPPAVVRVAGMVYRTAPLDLIVRSGSAVPAPDRAASSSSLSITLDPDTVYVGEQVTLYAEATFAEEMRTRQSRPATFDPPAPTGFWIQDLPDPISVTLRVREGRTVETQTYRRAYFPLAPGTYHFPPARLHYEVRRGFLYAAETRELVSDSVPLVVLPVPAAGMPSAFNGAVGRLTLRASVAPVRVRAGEATLLTVELEGSGNVKALPEPRLPPIDGAEVFAPAQDSRVDVNDNRVGGSKRFRWMLVPEQPGTLVIPPVEYDVFDPELGSYIALRSDTLRIEVAPVTTVVAADTALRPLRTLRGTAALDWVRSPGFVVVQIVPLLALLGALSVRRRRERLPGPRDEAAELRRQLGELRAREPAPGVLSELERIVREAVVRVAGGEGEPVAALRSQKRPAAAAELESLLRELQRLRFAPAEAFDAERLIDRVEAFIALIAPRRGWKRAPGTPVIALVALPGLLASAQIDPDELFFEGVERYERGEFAAAASSFARYTEAVPRDPSGWYDYGLAAHRAGDTGRAAWAWLRSIQLDPRDADVRQNLRAIGADAALAAVQPIDWLSAPERALLAAIGWWLMTLGIAVRIARRGRWSAAAPGATILAIAIIGSATVATRPTLVTPMGQGAALYAAPTTRDDALGELPPGSAARLVERRDGWVRVRTESGQDGWVERRAVASL
ncbi:MAG TPA: BatD family protein [Longimicrobiales bacterium]